MSKFDGVRADTEQPSQLTSDEIKDETKNVEAIKDVHMDSTKSQNLDRSEYPSGLGLAFIVLAIILSIFLASLDMV